MNQSDNITDLVIALCKTQSEMHYAKKDSNNPFYKSKYADLASCWEACKDVMTKNGLSISQGGEPSTEGMVMITTLFHISGQWIRSRMPIAFIMPPDKNNKEERRMTAQEVGSAIKYFRRYSLCAILSICDDDDDANTASKREDENKKLEPKLGPAQLIDLKDLLKSCPVGYEPWLCNLLIKDTTTAKCIENVPFSAFDYCKKTILAYVEEQKKKNAPKEKENE